MIRLPAIPQATSFPASSWLRTLRSSVERTRPVTGGSFNIQESVSGYFIEPKRKEAPRLRWLGDFDENCGYFPGDIVQVTADVAYQGKDSAYVDTIYESFKGTYMCEYAVPFEISEEELAIYNQSAAYLYNYMSTLNTRLDNVVYAPFYPEPDITPDEVTATNIQGRYWKLIAFGPTEVNLCRDGITEMFWVHGALSGSATQ